MRQSERAVILTCSSVFWLACAAAGGDSANVAADIKATAERLLAGPKDDPAEGQKLVLHLVDLASAIGQEGKLAEPFRTRLKAARDEAQRASRIGDGVITALKDAYAHLNAGRPFAVPEGLRDFEAVLEYGRGQVERSASALVAGRSEEAARELMGFILLVVTPFRMTP